MRYCASVSTPAQPGSSRDRSSKATLVAMPDATTRKNRPATTARRRPRAPASMPPRPFLQAGVGRYVSSVCASAAAPTSSPRERAQRRQVRTLAVVEGVAARKHRRAQLQRVVLSENWSSRSGDPITEDVRWRMRSGRSLAAMADRCAMDADSGGATSPGEQKGGCDGRDHRLRDLFTKTRSRCERSLCTSTCTVLVGAGELKQARLF